MTTQKEIYNATNAKAQYAINYYNKKVREWYNYTREQMKKEDPYFKRLCKEGKQLGEQYNLTLND